jgi:hypothetical protein
MARLTLEEGTLQVTRDSPLKPVSLRLDALRLVSLFLPGNLNWQHAETAADCGLIDLNEIDSADLAQLVEELATVEGEDAAGIRLFLEDYSGRYVTLTLPEIRESEVDLLQELAEHRRARRDRLAGWTRNVPGLIVTGLEGDMATFDLEGIRTGPDRFLSWEDLAGLEIREGAPEGPADYRLIPRRGHGARHVVRIPRRKAQLFLAEFAFWRSLAAQRAQHIA